LAQWEQLEKEEIKRKKEKKSGKNERKGLTLTGLLMEGTDHPQSRLDRSFPV